MGYHFGRLFVLLSILSFTLASARRWPNYLQDELDYARHSRTFFPGRFVSFPRDAIPCRQHVGHGLLGARTNAADWLRTAYHDMATYDSKTGTGGLDGSIRFETDRAENPGDGFNNTFAAIAADVNRWTSIADMIAMLAVAGVEECGGPKINFRGGRIDALKPNAPGVPEPQGSLHDHIKSFARQGFNREEMIALVACGHTLGGVQTGPFPDIVPDPHDPDNPDGQQVFDTTAEFDNNVVTEYLDGSTRNPLVVGHNDTTNSDKRIFSSDRNATMIRLRNPNTFRKTCATLLARMLDTVPKTTHLTDVIEPLPVFPLGVRLYHKGNGTMGLSGIVRFWDMPSNPQRIVRIGWDAPRGKGSLVLRPLGGGDFMGTHMEWYSFKHSPFGGGNDVVFNDTTVPTKFWFEVSEGDGRFTIHDQKGPGFPVPDRRVMLSSTSCQVADTSGSSTWTIKAAILKGSRVKRVVIKIDDVVRKNSWPMFINVETIDMVKSSGEASRPPHNAGSYDLWSISIPDKNGMLARGLYTVEVVFSDGTTVETPFSSSLPMQTLSCSS